MISDSQSQVRVKTALPQDDIVFRSMTMSEEISTPFEIGLDLLSEDDSIDFDAVLGNNVTVSLDRPQGGERYFSGFCTAFSFTGMQGRLFAYHATVSPWLWFLTQTETCRIFHEKGPLAIVKEVFNRNGFSGYRDDTTGSYPDYEYCVQYNETDFNFVSRILEKEGIFYYFEHKNGSHVLVLVDAPSSLVPMEAYETLTFHPRDQNDTLLYDGVFTWLPERRVLPTTYATNDFNFKEPRAEIDADATIGRGHAVSALSVYEYPGGYRAKGDGDSYARRRIEALQTGFETVRGETNARGVCAGYVFALTEHPIGRNNDRHLVVSARHTLRSQDYESVGNAGQQDLEPYACTFETVPARTPFRPAPRARKPQVIGPQTAIVVNDTQGEEIEPDEFGRVKVSFHWERADEKSCWVRVSQAWAGAEWGAMSIPRAGQEVVVEFVDGDPDRPIITGRVYNAASKPPYPPKSKPTVTTFKTNSSKGGGGFNELRFDDEKGKENVFIHAQKNFDLRTGVTRREAVGADVHTEIGKNEMRTVGAERHETVGESLYVAVAQDSHRDTGMNVLENAGMDVVVTAGKSVHVKAGATVVIEAGTAITLKAGSSFITLGPAGVAIQGAMVLINSGGSALPGPGTKPKKAEKPEKARKGKPGGISPAARSRSFEVTAQQISSHPVAARIADAAASGARYAPTSNA